MALNKKKSRIIIIDDTAFRWVVAPNDGFNVFVAEKESVKGRKIEVYFNMYLNDSGALFPIPEDLKLRIIKPKEAEKIIRKTLELGWNPDEQGKPIVFDLVQERIKVR